MNSKEMSLLAGVATGSLIVGGLFGYYVSSRKGGKASGGRDPNADRVHKATGEFASDLDKYVLSNSAQEPAILSELREYTCKNVSLSIMLTDPIEAQLFRILLSMLNARKCVEVGVYTGYNSLNMAMSIPSDGIVYALDISSEFVSHGQQFFEKANVGDKIDVRIAPAAETLDKLIAEGHAGTIDFIFIDADKTGYETYYEKGLVLLRQGGIIALGRINFQSGISVKFLHFSY